MKTPKATPTPSAPQAILGHLAMSSRQRPVWLRVGQLIDGESSEPHLNADIVFDAHHIHFVGTRDKTPPRKDLAEGQDAPDAVLPHHTLLPCLIEAHAHLFLDGTPVNLEQREQYLKQTPEWMLKRALARWPRILACGIATVRDAGDKCGVGLALSAHAKIRRNQLSDTPWIDSPGAAIHHRGRYGSFMGAPLEDHADEAACVADRVRTGSDRIKLLVSGIINFKAGRVTTPPQMSIPEVKALVQAARHHHRQTFAHASGTEGVEHSIEGGVTTVEHGFFITEEQLAKMRDRHIAWVPTFAPVQVQIDRAAELGWNDEVVGHLQRIIEGHQKMLRKAQEMGVTVVAGSDAGGCGVPHGIGFLQELCQMETAGMRPMNILRSATGVSAAVLQFGEPVGRIAPTQRSRMILTTHDPLATVTNLFKEKTILFDGTAIHAPEKIDPNGL